MINKGTRSRRRRSGKLRGRGYVHYNDKHSGGFNSHWKPGPVCCDPSEYEFNKWRSNQPQRGTA